MTESQIHKDTYYVSDDRKVLTQQQIPVPGLEMIGKHTIKTAISPIGTHYHPCCFEFTFLLKGSISFSVNGREYQLNGGDVFFTYPDEVHSSNLKPLSVSDLVWFQIDISNPGQLLFLNAASASLLISQLNNLTERTLHNAGRNLTRLADEAFQAAFRLQNAPLTSAYLVLILQMITGSSNLYQTHLTEDIQMSVDYILEHITEPLAFDTLADICHLSVSAYKQKFKSQLGTTPRNYINRKKIEMAKSLLDSGHSVTETAVMLGFNTSSYFTTVFKKYAFYTPTDYVNQLKCSSEVYE